MVEVDNLERTISILAFLGVRLLQLRANLTIVIYLRKHRLVEEAKKVETQSCSRVLEEDEWKLLLQIHPMKGLKPRDILSMIWVYKVITKMGGFNDTKRTGLAGRGAIRMGWEKLQERAEGYKMAKEMLVLNGAL